jgi:3-oxoacyl-[acyl-carrier protein] reductase
MNLGIEGKRALVTGASSGLGAAAATALLREGAEVIINSRDKERLKAAASKMQQKVGRTPLTVAADVSNAKDVEEIARKAGQVDIFVSNAGGPPPGDFYDHPSERWHEMAELVLHSAINLTRAFLTGMKERGWGRLIYITSVGVLQPIDTLILSNTYRAGVVGFCKTISNNYARYGITANCVCPGYTNTERLQELAARLAEQSGGSPNDVMAGFAAASPAGRIGEPEELAALIAFLAGEPAAYITGASIPVDGGVNKALV